MANETIQTKKVTDLPENTTVQDTDLFIVGSVGAASLRKLKWTNIFKKINDAVKAKVLEWAFDALKTTDKTIIGAINELNTDITVETLHDSYTWGAHIKVIRYLDTLIVAIRGTFNTTLYADTSYEMQITESASGAGTVITTTNIPIRVIITGTTMQITPIGANINNGNWILASGALIEIA